MNAEFPKSSDQDILTGCQGSLDDFQDGFDEFRGLGLGMAKITMGGINNVGFREGHGGAPVSESGTNFNISLIKQEKTLSFLEFYYDQVNTNVEPF
jgi:hypothetical protein